MKGENPTCLPVRAPAAGIVAIMVIAVGLAAPAVSQTSNPSPADFCGGVIGMILKVTHQSVLQHWNNLGSEVEQCVGQRTGTSAEQFAQHCMEPNDRRVSGVVAFCRQAVSQAHARQEAERRARDAQIAAQRAEQARIRANQEEAAARARAAQQAAEERARQAVLAAQAREKAREEARRMELAGKYGDAAADAIMQHKVLKDMNKDEVIEALGLPQSKQVVPPDDEMWRYVDTAVILINGKVTYIGR